MASDQVKRKLAAILAADIAGYSRLMGADEAGTLARLKEYRRELIDPKNKQYRGRVVKTTGDGILIEFPSVVDAISCSIEVQLGMCERNADIPPEKRIEFRIGINLGDVIVEGRDLYGDGVNIAARLEGVAEPGGICISQTVLNHARGKIAFEFEDLGELALKNIVRPVHVYHLLLNSSRGDVASRTSEPPLALPDKPSIAVLPFQNMSDDPGQEYFADGMVEEITTALSRFKWLFVIARNSSFTFKGTSVDIKEVRRRLGVRYVLEGSVRKAGGKVRITGQLIDAATGAHLWADRFERDLTDVFALQDEVTVAVVSAIQPKLLQTEIAIATRRRPENLTSYDYFLRAMQQYYPITREGLAEAIRLSHRALELDPQFGFVAALQVSAIRKTSFKAMLSILNSSARRQSGFFAWH
ncbi:adenylate/guanylate cyclase domain-containing protein [Bradyrhizobium sp. CB82]|uniref:adenylate/guanylate cyclase domain-containing protein n=1 Tax=Bradyrhizobium sp. CB82 TaxID=3039159 RepID=UPI0024B06DA6|nr:adenylate/guanylate cyclase domain-containing protein [Bradyrhizobium sp. CB82]WFU39049.1 adenylate/guanylate cyclase domain-containing protein [Bradyrhizobium sp. CB82]